MLREILGGWKRRWQAARARSFRARASRHLYGPKDVVLAEDQALLVLLVKNGAYFLPKYLDHHLALEGIAHVLVIDNGSTDGTLEICQRARVSVIQNLLPVREHESALRSELAQAVAKGGWILFADSDELIESPAPLPVILQYCRARGFTAVLGQMLDRFSDRPQAELAGLSYPEAVAALDLYSLGQIEHIPYHMGDRTGFGWFLRGNSAAQGAEFLRGGLRAEVFGETPMLTKHSLVRNALGVQPMVHPHAASGVRVADVTLLLHHYKLAGDWIARDRAQVGASVWDHGEDARRLASLSEDFAIQVAAPQSWQGIAGLEEGGVLFVSPAFKRWSAR